MKIFGSKPIIGIAEDTLDFIIEACRDTHPDEFTGLLRAEDASDLDIAADGRIITDVLVVPEMSSGDVLSVLGVDLLPRNAGSVGTVRSDPDGEVSPDEEDVSRFSRRGECHIIVAHPYDRENWKAYDDNAMDAGIEVYDVEFEDAEEFTSKEGFL